MIEYLIFGTTFAFAAAVQPGQLQAYLISQAIANGWRRTVPAALAPIFSDVPIVCLVLVVLTRVPPSFVNVLRLAGGLFLLYLAWGAVRTCMNYEQAATTPARPAHETVLKAIVVNLLNPNPYLGWTLVMGPLLLKAWRDAPLNGIVLVAAFYLTIVVVTAAIVILFAFASKAGPRVARALVGASAAGLAGFGLYQLWSGARAFLG